MNLNTQLQLLADYNQWQNQQLYKAASALSPAELAMDKGAFFGSILGTFNHLLIGDLVWLKRFAQVSPDLAKASQTFPKPSRLNELLYTDFQELSQQRFKLDALIIEWTATLPNALLEQPLPYQNMAGVAQCKSFFSLLLHFYTHQVHHRGQITTLLSQAGIDFGETDLVIITPNISE
jgi:uncharacterized damage-inducible protein DinB